MVFSDVRPKKPALTICNPSRVIIVQCTVQVAATSPRALERLKVRGSSRGGTSRLPYSHTKRRSVRDLKFITKLLVFLPTVV